MRMRDEIGEIYADEAFAPLFSVRGQPAEAPWRLALVTIMQYAEGLPDRHAADAVRSRNRSARFVRRWVIPLSGAGYV
jgi:transposase